ncbi:hypothetical protein K6V92_00365 [Cupriavidus respiraculi]|uniref:hypothetical protein n=1 Tax=Cupriavidus respiraculi TaxID=195930 RepID=UPI001C9397D0|nr:hypothetical protein [Cupriavidus respiraculi]MBY4945077.1 hypothetical protein [Cupriavidus respiraculi]
MKDTAAKVVMAAAAVAALAYIVKKNGGLGAAVAGAAGSIGQALGGAVVSAGEGVVYGIGDALGVPRTDMTECERAIAEGRTWDASFACPASNFLASILGDARPDYPGSIADYFGTYASGPVTPWTVTENAGGAAFVYPRIKR